MLIRSGRRPRFALLLTSAFFVACSDGTGPSGPPPTHPLGVIAGQVALDGRPYGAAVSSQGVVYVALVGSSILRRGLLQDMTFPDTVEVGEGPPHVEINPAGTRAFATIQTGQGLAAVDVASNTLIGVLPLPSEGFNLIVGKDGTRVYATTNGGFLYIVNTGTMAVETTLPVGPAANGLALTRDGATLYVSSRNAGTVVAIRTANHSLFWTYDVGGVPQRLAVSPDGSLLYVANEQTGLDVVNTSTGEVIHRDLGTMGYGLALTPDGTQLYLALPLTGEVRILDRATLAVVKSLTIGGLPRNVTFDRSGQTAIVTNEESVTFIK